MKDNLKNYGLWLSLFALLGLFLSDMSWMPDNYELYVQLILAILIALGIVTSPSIRLNKDDPNKKDGANKDTDYEQLYIQQTQNLIHEIAEANKRKEKELKEFEEARKNEEEKDKEECNHCTSEEDHK